MRISPSKERITACLGKYSAEEKALDKTYVAIDLKSFYASVELSDRRLDPLSTHLVVADSSRTEKTICLAVSPSLKAYGISGRARLFEVVEQVKAVNARRFREAAGLGKLPMDPETGKYRFSASSCDAKALEADPSLEADYIVAPPRMRLYEEISTKIVRIYMKYVSPEDVHVYSVDECFMDVTGYLESCGLSARELASVMIRDVLRETGITAAAGVGPNLYLAKIAMDIEAKHVPEDENGVRIAELDEKTYRERLWCHRPLTDFWRVGKGVARRLDAIGCRTMGDVARMSLAAEDALYDALGVNAELLIDHAWGREPTEISMIHAFEPETNSLSAGQVLPEPYDFETARLVVREMAELMALDLVRKGVVTRQVILTVNYDRSCIEPAARGASLKEPAWRVVRTGKRYTGEVTSDYYGRPAPKPAHGSENLDRWTSSARRFADAMTALYDKIVDPGLTVRRLSVAACNLLPESEVPEEAPEQLDLFTDYEALDRQKAGEAAAEMREKSLQKTALAVHGKFGKNALLKGMNLQEGATAMQRNGMIGGHRAGDESVMEKRDME